MAEREPATEANAEDVVQEDTIQPEKGPDIEQPPEQVEEVDKAEEALAAEGVVDETTALRQELEEAAAKAAEYLDGWQRARAELANARKRFERERQQAYSNARGDVLVQILPLLDDFERAVETLPPNLSKLTWIEGVLLIQRKLQLLLEQAGVTNIEAAGQEFDPFRHEAVTHEPSETIPEGHVIAELQKGYQLGDRVLRPSVVRVSSGPPPEAESANG
jgi:molecular chaperone GrpE